jgi:hypothetical protein
MKTAIYFLLSYLLLSFLFFPVNGQNSYIYGIHTMPSGIDNSFARYDTTTGIITDLKVMNGLSGIGSVYTSCTDPVTNRYYFCSGKQLIGFDMSNGDIKLNQVLNIPSNTYFYNIQFNQCNGLFYGLLYNFSSVTLAEYDTTTSSFNTITSNLGIGILFGSMSFIDYTNSRFVWETLNTVAALDLSVGSLEFNTPIVNLPNEVFHHIAYKCSNHYIYGTSANPPQNLKYLAVFDTSSGNINHVSNPGWSTGLYKPTAGGFTIDQAGDIYYYIGTPGFIMLGASTVTGALVHNKNLNLVPGEGFFLIQKHGCTCSTTGAEELTDYDNLFTIGPVPFSNQITSTSGYNEPVEIILYDITSAVVIKQSFENEISINTQHLAKGIYFYTLRNRQKILKKGKIVKI